MSKAKNLWEDIKTGTLGKPAEVVVFLEKLTSSTASEVSEHVYEPMYDMTEYTVRLSTRVPASIVKKTIEGVWKVVGLPFKLFGVEIEDGTVVVRFGDDPRYL